MSAEPVPPRASSREGAETPLQEHTDQTAEAARALMPDVLSAVRDLGKASPEFRAEVARILASSAADDEGPRLRLVGRARKVSVSMPEDLTAAVQRRVGRGEFSQYVAEAVARQLELDLLGELATLLAAEHGPVSDEALTEARRSWPDAE
ncbi:hypothetical protein [Plantactinospora sp. GCM10030261]|uniref:hypothetical protein n=1 Tax=Plantactinospora sp. GCM10030261 TaxID=3273420 RepID=UPI0036092B0C